MGVWRSSFFSESTDVVAYEPQICGRFFQLLRKSFSGCLGAALHLPLPLFTHRQPRNPVRRPAPFAKGMAMLKPLIFLSATLIAAPAAALTFSFNAGPVIFKDDFPDTPEEIAAFDLGEDVLVTITIDPTAEDLDDDLGRGLFEDEFGDLKITGATTGAMIEMLDIGIGVEIDTAREIDFDTLFLVSDLDPFGLSDLAGSDIDIGFAGDVFSDPDTLATSLAEFTALIGPDGNLLTQNTATASTALLDFYLPGIGEGEPGGPPVGSGDVFVGLEFGPVQSVPAPAGLPLLMLGLGALVFASRRRSEGA